MNARDVQEAVFILMLFIDGAHQRGGWGQDLVDENEDSFLRRELDSLADYVDELANSEVGGDKVLFLVDGCNVGLLNFLADNLGVDRVRKGSVVAIGSS